MNEYIEINFNKIGYKEYWGNNIVPYITESKKVMKEIADKQKK